MSKIGSTIHEIHHMDTLSSRDQWMNRIHPLVKFLVTVGYIAAVVSFPKYDVVGLAGMVVYPIAGFLLLHLPKPMVTQFMLTYRYITVLLEEANRMTQAYALRAPKQKGVHFRVWGSLTGQLLLRSMDHPDRGCAR